MESDVKVLNLVFFLSVTTQVMFFHELKCPRKGFVCVGVKIDFFGLIKTLSSVTILLIVSRTFSRHM